MFDKRVRNRVAVWFLIGEKSTTFDEEQTRGRCLGTGWVPLARLGLQSFAHGGTTPVMRAYAMSCPMCSLS